MYTSGTTGVPKGAMLSHRNIVAAVAAADGRFHLDTTDRHLSYLPLAHIFETAVQCAAYAKGAQVGMFQGNIKLLTADMATLKPTLLCGVPRVFTKFYQKFWAAVSGKSFLARYVAGIAYNTQSQNVRSGSERSQRWDDKIFLREGGLRSQLGLDQCKVIITGAAPCPPYLMEFLKVAINCNIIQGYGMTETAAIIAVMYPDDNTTGHVGPPCACNQVRLEDVPEMNYGHNNEDNPKTGEICVKGDNIFVGYFKNEEATKKTIVDGWLHTGDIGRWNNNGTLSIIDRRKNIFKLAQGEYVAAEKIELVYAKSPAVGQIWVYGNSYKSFILAVVVPNAEYVFKWATSTNNWPDTSKEGTTLASQEFRNAFNELFQNDATKTKAKDFVFASMKEQNHHLFGFEKVKDIIIESTLDGMLAGFTEENQCSTPTFKLRRPYLLNRYVEQLKSSYAANGSNTDENEHWPGVKK
jgi:long-chain acyl-CoA synthetase